MMQEVSTTRTHGKTSPSPQPQGLRQQLGFLGDHQDDVDHQSLPINQTKNKVLIEEIPFEDDVD